MRAGRNPAGRSAVRGGLDVVELGVPAAASRLVLAECLAADPLQAALTSYERRRRARLSWVLSQTHRRDRTRGLPPLIRNLVLRTAGTRLSGPTTGPCSHRPESAVIRRAANRTRRHARC